MNVETIINKFKVHFEDETGIRIDFRKHVFLDNQYGGTPCFNYDFAQSVVSELYAWAHEHLSKDNPCQGWIYNAQMECEKLRRQRLII